MSIDDETYAALLEAFTSETDEGLALVEEKLIALEQDPENADAVADMFRAMHTIKGNAAIFDFAEMSALAHASEDLLVEIRDGKKQVTAQVIRLLLDSVDGLRRHLGMLVRTNEEAGETAETAGARLRGDRAATPGSRDTGEGADQEDAPATEVPTAARSFRVAAVKLDRLLTLTGEIAISRGRLGQLLSDPAVSRKTLVDAHQDAERLHMDMQELVMQLRMTPVGPRFRQLARTVHDLAQSLGKEVDFLISGDDVEVDMTVVELLRDPLMHMIRNSVDHGIELPEARRAAGKSARGTIWLRSRHESGSIVIELEDDGAGLNRKRILDRARKRGLVRDDEVLADADLFGLVFHAGFSTADEVTEVSGRGVGLDVVRRNIERIHGSLRVESQAGSGTKITIRLPLTLAIIEGLHLDVGGESYLVPLQAVIETQGVPTSVTAANEATGLYDHRGESVPFVRLRHRLGTGSAPATRENAVIVRHPGGLAVLIADLLVGTSQAIVRPLPKLLRPLPFLSGSTILPSGAVAFILDVDGLATFERDRARRTFLPGAAARPGARRDRPARTTTH